MRERITPFINFKEGINAVPGIFGERQTAARDLLNLYVNDEGWLAPRQGREDITVSFLGDSLQRYIDSPRGVITLGTRSDEEIHYVAGSQLVIVHWNGDEQDDPTTRAYLLDESDSWVSVQNGRILFIAGDNGSWFIDLKSNRRLSWGFGTSQVSDIDINAGFSTTADQFNRLVAELLINFANSRQNDVWTDFPFEGELTFTATDIKPYAVKVSYSGSDIGFSGPSSRAVVTLLSLEIQSNPLFSWILANRTALLDNVLVTGYDAEDDQIIGNINQGTSTIAYIDKTNLPSWQGVNFKIDIYAAELPEAIYRINDGEIEVTDEIAVQAIPDSDYVRVGQATSDTTNPQSIPISLTGDDVVYLDAQFNAPPPQGLYAITEHAGRIYGVDGRTQEIVFTHIDGQGVSNRFVFPQQNRLSTDASGTAPVVALEQMPDRGGLYVFKRDATHYIDGQNIWSGLYSIQVGTTTDISAAAYKENIGCIAPRSIENDGTRVLFVGSDEQIYALSGRTASPIGATVKPFLREVDYAQLRNISTEWYNEKFYITLPDSVLILNTEHKYWTRYDWELSDVFWFREDGESTLYGLAGVNTLQKLEVETDEDFPILWDANLQIRNTHSLLTGIYVYTEDGESVRISVSGNEPPTDYSEEFTPGLSNRYRAGCYVKGRHLDVKVEADTPITIDRIDLEETY